MRMRVNPRSSSLTLLLLAASCLVVSPSQAESATSEFVTWSCTGTPCPWGPTDVGHALVWPDNVDTITQRLGYTVSKGVYLPSNLAAGTTINVLSGSASVYAGTPGANSHYFLVTISAGGSYVVPAIGTGEVISVQSAYAFDYEIELAAPQESEDPVEPENPPAGTASQFVTWSCTSSPCPWGPTDIGHALVWPAESPAISDRLGYTASKAVYLPSNAANGATVTVLSGTATVYAGLPGANSHYALTTISAGGNYEISGLAAGEVVSVQSSADFTYEITLPEPVDPTDPTDPSDPNEPGPVGPASQFVTWSCTGTPCPWGPTDTAHALAWPESAGAISQRLGYTASAPVYLPASLANGAIIWVNSGTATVYAGEPNGSSHYSLATVSNGDFYEVSGLAANEVLSVQSSSPFTYQIALPDPPPPGESRDIIPSVQAFWRCDMAGCTDDDWVGAVINWPSWAAYSTNNRTGDQSRTVHSSTGELLYPYMGAWANGCQVTAESGLVLIIEWERGTNYWREIWLGPGETHTISLTSPENGAMIETYDYSPGFSVSLNNCTPQPLP